MSEVTELRGRASHVFRIAESLFDEHEEGGNNRGPLVRKLFRGYRDKGNWCAAYVAWCFEEAPACPIIDDRYRRGAKGLAKYVAREFNGWVTRDPDVANPNILPGDVIAWHRLPPPLGRLDWRGHTELIRMHEASTDTLTTYAGNVGRYPAHPKVRIYPDGAWRRRLFGISRLLPE